MSEDKYKNRYRIPSARANWHDYLGGAYFVTICTKDCEFYFGKIEDDQMHLSEIGKYADEQFRDVSLNYPYAVIPSYVVMPNHIHAIVIIDDRMDAACISNTIHCVSEWKCKRNQTRLEVASQDATIPCCINRHDDSGINGTCNALRQ